MVQHQFDTALEPLKLSDDTRNFLVDTKRPTYSL